MRERALGFRDVDDLELRTDPADGDSEWTTSSMTEMFRRSARTGGSSPPAEPTDRSTSGRPMTGHHFRSGTCAIPQGVQSLSFSPYGSTLLSSAAGRLMTCESSTASPREAAPRPAPFSNHRSSLTLNRLALAPDGHILAAAEGVRSGDNVELSGRDVSRRVLDRYGRLHDTHLVFLEDEEVALVGNTGQSVFNVTTGQLVRSEEFEFADDVALIGAGDQVAIARDGAEPACCHSTEVASCRSVHRHAKTRSLWARQRTQVQS